MGNAFSKQHRPGGFQVGVGFRLIGGQLAGGIWGNDGGFAGGFELDPQNGRGSAVIVSGPVGGAARDACGA